MKHIIGLLAMLLPILSAAQSPPVKALSIGDTVPDISPGAIINYTQSAAQLSDFKNDLVILDFWSTWCAPCIKALPEFQELQSKFGNRLQFVLATSQEAEKIQKFLQLKNIMLPCFVGDKELSKYFPHNSVPHEVWIKNDTIAAITYSENVTAQNIQKVLNGEQVNMVEKKANFDYDISKPLLIEGNGGHSNDLLYHSVITSYLDGISGGGGIQTDSLNRFKIRAIDASIARLYATAAQQSDLSFMLSNRLLIEATEKEKLLPQGSPDYTSEIRQYFYSYELIVPASDKKNAGAYMMQDLNRYFHALYHIRGSIEKRKMLCWVLRKEDDEAIINTKNGVARITERDGYEIFENQPFESLFYTMAYINMNQPHPFVDKTGITGNVDMALPLNIKDIAALRYYLTRYHLKLSLEQSEIAMLVIKNIH
jgi:thiol-disulfide isomerase/thioredoxin